MSLPITFYAGDTVSFSGSFTTIDGTYTPNNGYSAAYALRGSSSLDVTGSANGTNDGWVFTIPAVSSSTLGSGAYQYEAYVFNVSAGTRYTVDAGFVTVQTNLSTSTALSRITHAEKMIALIESVLEGRFTDDVQAATINGRSITKIPVQELLHFRAMYKRELFKLKYPEASTTRDVPVVFDFYPSGLLTRNPAIVRAILYGSY